MECVIFLLVMALIFFARSSACFVFDEGRCLQEFILLAFYFDISYIDEIFYHLGDFFRRDSIHLCCNLVSNRWECLIGYNDAACFG